MTLLLACAIQVTVILTLAVGSMFLLRGKSAALRHWVLSSALILSAVLPLFNFVVPSWSVPAVVAEHPIVAPLRRQISTLTLPALSPAAPIAVREKSAIVRWLPHAIWLAGAMAGLLVLIAGLVRLVRLASVSRPMSDGRWTRLAQSICGEYGLRRPVEILETQNPSILVTWGVSRPRIIVPAGAAEWAEDRTNIVLRHELAHIRRRDWFVQMIAQLLRIVYWFNPIVWLACSRLRLESECACDDAVLSRDIEGHEYARHLLELARTLNTTGMSWSAVLAMARPSTIERRFSAMLNPSINRRPLSRTAMLVIALIGLCITASLPAMRSLRAATQPVAGQETVERPPMVQSPAAARAIGQRIGNGTGNGIGNGIGNGVVVPPQDPGPDAGPSAEGTEMLLKLYDSSQDMPMKFRILDHLSVSNNPKAQEKLRAVANSDAEPEMRRHAMDFMFIKASVETLISMFDSSRDTETKLHVLDYLSVSDSPQAAEKMLAVARSEADPEMQRRAIDYISVRPGAYDMLVSLYDSSRQMQTKAQVLDYLSQSNDPRAMQKLFSIAQSDPDLELRRRAVDYIAAR